MIVTGEENVKGWSQVQRMVSDWGVINTYFLLSSSASCNNLLSLADLFKIVPGGKEENILKAEQIEGYPWKCRETETEFVIYTMHLTL